MIFNKEYRDLSEQERIDLTTKIVNALESLNLTEYPVIATNLVTAEGRLAILEKISNAYLENNFSIEELIQNIENID